MIKQVIVMRTDLNMRKGKMCAQAAHASMKVMLDLSSISENISGTSSIDLVVPLTAQMMNWLAGAFTKVVVGVPSSDELFQLLGAARAADIPCTLIEDNGNTEFHGVKTPTCIAIGPDDAEKIDAITGKLKLL